MFMRVICLFLALFLVSCSSNFGTGLFSGALIGASAGGAASGGKGSLIGLATGVVTGGILGFTLDEQDRKVMERKSPRTVTRIDRGDPLTINDVIKLSQAGVSDQAILQYVEGSSTLYELSVYQIRRLQDAGVSQNVIDRMMTRGK